MLIVYKVLMEFRFDGRTKNHYYLNPEYISNYPRIFDRFDVCILKKLQGNVIETIWTSYVSSRQASSFNLIPLFIF